jgi:hypothetical protein
MTDEDKKRQAEVLLTMSKLPKDASIEDFNKLRLTKDIVTHEVHKLRASFIVPEKQRLH